MKEFWDFMSVFGGMIIGSVVTVFSVGALWRGISARFDKQDLLLEQNTKEHVEMKADISDHEARIRRYEWNRPIREGD